MSKQKEPHNIFLYLTVEEITLWLFFRMTPTEALSCNVSLSVTGKMIL